jgi:F-type H+-transporting ATPase subunit delta
MLSKQLALKYAQAIFELATDKNAIEVVGLELATVERLISSQQDMTIFMYHPRVPAAAKKEVLSKVLEGINQYVRNFLFLLIDRHRESAFPDIVKEYSQLYNKACNIVEAEVITAMPLTATEQELLKNKLNIATGKKVLIKSVIDAQVIGGVIIKMGDKLIDGSVKRQLNTFKDALLSFEVTKIGVTDLV